jgi:hypothetical protein
LARRRAVTDVAVALIEWLAHVGLAAVQALAWFGLGWLALRRLRTGERTLDALNAIGAGAVGFALLTFALGLLGLLYTAPILVATLAAAAAGALVALPAGRRLNVRAALDRPRWQLALIAVLAATAVVGLVATGAPVNGFDALAYHVSVPAVYEEQHEVLELPWSWHSYQPFTVEMLITDGLLLWDTVQGAFASFLLVVAATAAVVVGGRMVGGTGLGLVAGAIFGTQPLVAWEATAALVDGGIAFASALAALNLLVWARTGQATPLVLAGAFAGAAAGMKYVGLFVALAVGLATLLIAGSRVRLSTIAAVAVPGALVALPWYAKNWVLTGNPLFPFVFGGLSESAQNGIEDTVGAYGFGRTPLDALLLPVRLVTDSQAFDGADWLSPLVLVFPLLALLDRTRRRGVLIALACCGFYLVCWFLTSQQARFLIPMLPVLSVLAALGVAATLRAGPAGRALAIAGAATTILFGLAVFAAHSLQFVPVVAGVESRERFLADRTAYYDGITWLNRRLGDDETVLIDFGSPYLEPRWVLWSALTFPGDGRAGSVRRSARANRLRYAAVLEVNEPARRRQLADLRARRVAAIDVHTAYLGLRRWGGVPHRLLVYELGSRDGR